VNPYAYGGAPFAPAITAQQELDDLKGQAEYLEDSLDGIKKRIEELESQKSSKE
jgi:prefoldin subunit 5